MTDGVLSPNGKLLIHDGRVMHHAPSPCTNNACPLCGVNGTGFYRWITTEDIVPIFNACVLDGFGSGSSGRFTVTPSIGPNVRCRLEFTNEQHDLYGGAGQLVTRYLAQDALFQKYPFSMQHAYCQWGGTIPCTGQFTRWHNSTTCGVTGSGSHTHYTITAIGFTLKLHENSPLSDYWDVLGFYYGYSSDPGTQFNIINFAYGLVDRTNDDLEVSFDSMTPLGTASNYFSGGTGIVRNIGDKLTSDGYPDAGYPDNWAQNYLFQPFSRGFESGAFDEGAFE